MIVDDSIVHVVTDHAHGDPTEIFFGRQASLSSLPRNLPALVERVIEKAAAMRRTADLLNRQLPVSPLSADAGRDGTVSYPLLDLI